MRRLFRQFSFPGGIPSHVAPETPGSIHEGGELGYSLATPTAPRSTTRTCSSCCVVGDGEAETGPLAASWHSNKFLNPARDGAVLPILHLNGYKIANPTVLARIPADELRALLEGYGYAPRFVEGDEPGGDAPADGGDARRGRSTRSPRSSARARERRRRRAAALADDRAAHAEGLDRAEGRSTACRSRARSARTRCRSPTCATNPEHLAQLEEWMRSLPARGAVRRGRRAARPSSPRCAPAGERRMSANPHANGGLLLRDLELPDFRDYAVDVPAPGDDARARRPACSARSCAT